MRDIIERASPPMNPQARERALGAMAAARAMLRSQRGRWFGSFRRLARWQQAAVAVGGFLGALFVVSLLFAAFSPAPDDAIPTRWGAPPYDSGYTLKKIMKNFVPNWDIWFCPSDKYAKGPAKEQADLDQPVAQAPRETTRLYSQLVRLYGQDDMKSEHPYLYFGFSPHGTGTEPDAQGGPAAAESYGSLETWGRQLVLTASMAMEVKDVSAAYERIQRLAAQEGALVTGGTLKASPGAEPKEGGYGQATLVLRVPQRDFHAMRDRLRRLAGDLGGRVLSDEVTSDDVTEEYVDLQARLRNWRAQETQLLDTMRQARKIPDILSVRDRLAEVQQQIERLTGRLRFLENRVDLSTINVEIRQKGKAPVAPGLVDQWKDAGRSLVRVWRQALVNIVYLLGMIGALLIYLLPFAILGGVVWGAVRVVRARAFSQAPGA